jgi:hypothetical protein
MGFETLIPLEVLSNNQNILTPLTDVEKEEEREVALYTVPFVSNLDKEGGIPVKKTPTKKRQHEKEVRGKQAIDSNEILEDVNIIWKETFKSNTALYFNDPVIKEKIVIFTNKLTKRSRQIEKDQAVTQNILKSSIGPQFKEAMDTLNNNHTKEKKTREA